MKIKRALILANCLLAGLILFTGVRVASRWMAQPRDRETQSVQDGTELSSWGTGAAPRPLEAYQEVMDQDPFRTMKGSGKEVRQPEKLRSTTLQVKLKGTILGQGQRSYAVILDGVTGREDLYAQNDFVQGARILEIQKDRVILSAGGARESLEMDSGMETTYREAPAGRVARPSPPARAGRGDWGAARKEVQKPVAISPPKPVS
jgi:hypothetical protein